LVIPQTRFQMFCLLLLISSQLIFFSVYGKYQHLSYCCLFFQLLYFVLLNIIQYYGFYGNIVLQIYTVFIDYYASLKLMFYLVIGSDQFLLACSYVFSTYYLLVHSVTYIVHLLCVSTSKVSLQSYSIIMYSYDYTCNHYWVFPSNFLYNIAKGTAFSIYFTLVLTNPFLSLPFCIYHQIHTIKSMMVF